MQALRQQHLRSCWCSSKTQTSTIPVDLTLRIYTKRTIWASCWEIDGYWRYWRNRFDREYSISGKSPTVKAKIVELLGSIARYHPSVIEKPTLERLKGECLKNLSVQANKTEKIEHQTSQGYLNCLNSLICRKDVELVPKNSSESETLFHIILRILQSMLDTNRYGTPVAAMALFTRHARLFSNLLLPNSENLYVCLYRWAGHHNIEASKNGLLAFEEFIKEVAYMHGVYSEWTVTPHASYLPCCITTFKESQSCRLSLWVPWSALDRFHPTHTTIDIHGPIQRYSRASRQCRRHVQSVHRYSQCGLFRQNPDQGEECRRRGSEKESCQDQRMAVFRNQCQTNRIHPPSASLYQGLHFLCTDHECHSWKPAQHTATHVQNLYWAHPLCHRLFETQWLLQYLSVDAHAVQEGWRPGPKLYQFIM